jgi:hypothetical protein
MGSTDGDITSEHAIGAVKTTAESNSGFTRKFSLRIGTISAINQKDNTVSVVWMDDRRGGFSVLDVGSGAYMGYRSGIRTVPEIGSIIVIGYAGQRTVPLAYLTPTDFSNLVNRTPDVTGGIPTFARILNSGEIDIYSSKAAELFLTDQVLIQDGKHNKILIDPKSSTISMNSINTDITNEAGRLFMGQITRTIPGTAPKVITKDGLPTTSPVGGKALNEFKIQINETSDSTNFQTNAKSTPIAEVVVGTVVNSFGLKPLNELGNPTVCQVKFKSGALIEIDDEGNININGGQMSGGAVEIAANKLASVAKLVNQNKTSLTAIPSFSIPSVLKSKQRAAREGDKVSIPLTPVAGAQEVLTHPGQLKTSLSNMSNMFSVAGAFMTIMGPCIFIPAGPMTLEGEIVEGAKGVFIGDLEATATPDTGA